MLISIDGIDGCGKSTQVARLAQRLEAQRLQEISDSRWGRKLRALKDPSLEEQLACFLADRALLAPRLEEAAGSRTKHIVSDRSYLSTVAYQSYDSGLAPSVLERINRVLVPEYDLMIVLDLPVDVALGRVTSRGGERDWCETEGRLTWARRVFETWASQRGNIALVDAQPGPDQVFEDVLAAAQAACLRCFGRPLF